MQPHVANSKMMFMQHMSSELHKGFLGCFGRLGFHEVAKEANREMPRNVSRPRSGFLFRHEGCAADTNIRRIARDILGGEDWVSAPLLFAQVTGVAVGSLFGIAACKDPAIRRDQKVIGDVTPLVVVAMTALDNLQFGFGSTIAAEFVHGRVVDAQVFHLADRLKGLGTVVFWISGPR
jgi:hypothetical protein